MVEQALAHWIHEDTECGTGAIDRPTSVSASSTTVHDVAPLPSHFNNNLAQSRVYTPTSLRPSSGVVPDAEPPLAHLVDPVQIYTPTCLQGVKRDVAPPPPPEAPPRGAATLVP